MSKPWAKIGAWAEEAEQAEAEEKEQAAAAAAATAASSVGRDAQSFPSLKEAVVNTKGKKKANKMSLHQFTTSAFVPGAASRNAPSFESKGLTPEEILRLPTGPKERSPEEMQYGRLGGGFSSYGRSSGPPPGRGRDRDSDGDGNWGSNRRSYGGFDDDRRGPPSRVSDLDQPSRADEVDNWAMAKKPMAFDSGPRPIQYASLGNSAGNVGFSKADEVDNWAVGKRPQVSVAPPPRSSSNFGSGFRDYSGPGPDRWIRGGGVSDTNQERPRLVLDKPRTDGAVNETAVVKTNKPNPFGAARPREEILAEKGVDWKKVDMELEAKKTSSRPTSSQSSRPGSAQSAQSEGPAAGQARPKINPFGDAKPREVLLEEKGLDWKKIDLELERHRVDRPETEAEKTLREEIENLKREFEKESIANPDEESLEVYGVEKTSLLDVILNKEKDLEMLTHELDDKVRFGQKAMQRPGSGAGRVSAFPERPHSRSGSFDESRNIEFIGRPRSRGTGDAWPRKGDDRRNFQSGGERGFLGNRDVNRSRDRW